MPVDITLRLDTETASDTIDVDLPEEWLDRDTVTTDDIEQLEEALIQFTDEYEGTGYRLDELTIVDNDDGNKYKGRDDGTPVIEVTDHHSLPGTTLHEIGHDVEKYHLGRTFREQTYNKLVSKTFSELFAHLNALHITDQFDEDYQDHFTWNLSRDKYEQSWETLNEAIDVSNRQEEQALLHTIVLEEDIQQIDSYTDELLDIPPVTVDDEETSHGHQYESHMFVEDLPMGDIDRKKQDLDALTSMLRMADERGDSRATRHVRYAHKHEDEASVNRTIVAATDDYLQHHDLFTDYREHLEGREMENEELEEQIQDAREQVITAEGRDILEYTFDTTLEQLKNSVAAYRQTLEDEDPAELVYDAASHEEYGYKRDGDPTEYDEYVDFPHNIGGTLALQLHEDGASPTDLLDDPDTYLEACEDAILSSIRTRLR